MVSVIGEGKLLDYLTDLDGAGQRAVEERWRIDEKQRNGGYTGHGCVTIGGFKMSVGEQAKTSPAPGRMQCPSDETGRRKRLKNSFVKSFSHRGSRRRA